VVRIHPAYQGLSSRHARHAPLWARHACGISGVCAGVIQRRSSGGTKWPGASDSMADDAKGSGAAQAENVGSLNRLK
jgi:hypothetical protein